MLAAPRYSYTSNFYPRPPRGGRPVPMCRSRPCAPISIHALREEGDVPLRGRPDDPLAISIHALREEGDRSSPTTSPARCNFYPRPPRGGRHDASPTWEDITQFLSTPSARRATDGVLVGRGRRAISIHALREEGDGFSWVYLLYKQISIHALREEGDLSPSASPLLQKISIHALREEGDSHWGLLQSKSR